MEFEYVDKWIEREARRVAAAFGVKTFDLADTEEDEVRTYQGTANGVAVEWRIGRMGRAPAAYGELLCIELGAAGEVCVLYKMERPEPSDRPEEEGLWDLYPEPKHHELMARGLFCLGIDYKDVDYKNIGDYLPQLTAHEKLELRLSMPREFWPQKWLDEEVGR